MSTHSPTPWYFDESDNAIYGEHVRPLVAAFSESFPPTVQNGLLMAAAPDLLEACELLLSEVYCNGVWCGFPACNTCAAIKQAEAAIQKARGEQ